MTITVRCVIQEGEKLYPQIYLDECLYELQKWYNFTELKILYMELILIKLINQKSVKFVIAMISAEALNIIQKFVMIVTGE